MFGSGAGQHALFARQVLHFLLQFLERTHLDLANTLAADVILTAQFFQRDRLILKASLGQDILLAPFAA